MYTENITAKPRDKKVSIQNITAKPMVKKVSIQRTAKPRGIKVSIQRTAKPRGIKETDTQVGNEINTTEVAKWLIRSPFDRNIVTLYDVQEQIFDYIFSHLGLNTDGYIDHPVVLTEPVCNPNYCRQQMSELLFECYNVPQVTYGIDAMFSLYANHDRMEDINSLIVSCGYQTTHLLPVLGGRLDATQCRRINLGGYHLETFMQRLLQLKYPGHFAAVSLNRAEELVRDHCHLAPDYNADLHEWVSNDYYDNNVHKIQLPYTNAPGNQLSAEQTKERREQQIKRLKEVTAKRRLEKLASEEQKLQELMSIQELLEDEDDDEAFDRALQNTSFDTPEELQSEINRLTIAIQRNRAKVLGIEPPPAEEKLLDARTARKQKKSDMAKRRTLASQQRMKMKHRESSSAKKKADTFGQNDADWDHPQNADSDSEVEEEQIEELEAMLREHDPEFQKELDLGGSEEFDIAEYYRLHLAIERVRVPELLFQPSMIGVEQAGIVETMDFLLHKYDQEKQKLLVQNVFLTGGNALFMNFKERLEKELLEMRPFQSMFSVTRAVDPVLDA
ncbi:ACTR5 [Mytilus edulis]|uniref:Actin-related protein 5 n=1 Tax=Mytilus edulis TaxID=6550 RepID=A0A8S3UFK9_MYTED|nr:ACTR5 [Mytilus edulis]